VVPDAAHETARINREAHGGSSFAAQDGGADESVFAASLQARDCICGQANGRSTGGQGRARVGCEATSGSRIGEQGY